MEEVFVDVFKQFLSLADILYKHSVISTEIKFQIESILNKCIDEPTVSCNKIKNWLLRTDLSRDLNTSMGLFFSQFGVNKTIENALWVSLDHFRGFYEQIYATLRNQQQVLLMSV